MLILNYHFKRIALQHDVLLYEDTLQFKQHKFDPDFWAYTWLAQWLRVFRFFFYRVIEETTGNQVNRANPDQRYVVIFMSFVMISSLTYRYESWSVKNGFECICKKASSQVSLRRLTWIDAFCHWTFLCMTKVQHTSWFGGWLYLTHSHTMTPFDAPGKHDLWKLCGKRRNCS